MKPLSGLSAAWFGRRREGDPGQLEAVIEILPQPTLLVETGPRRILLGNAKFTAFTGWERGQLVGKKVEELFIPDERDDLVAEGTGQPGASQSAYLLVARGVREKVRLSFTSMPPDGAYALLVVEAPPRTSRTSVQDLPAGLLEQLVSLACLPHLQNLESSLQGALETGSQVTGASILAVYLADGLEPGLRRFCSYGPADLLPEQLLAAELMNLRTPYYWTPGKRALSALHRAARANRLAYLASTPLDKPTSPVGVLVLAGTGEPENADRLVLLGRILAATITTLVQQDSRFSGLQQAEREIQRLHALQEVIADNMQQGIVYLDPNLTIQRLNPAAESILGYSEREIVGQPVDKILIGTQSFFPALEAALQGSSTPNVGSIHLYNRMGEALLARVSTLPVMSGEEAVGLVILIQDQSDSEEIRLRTQQLEQRAILGEFTAIFAHEVRNPINNISTGLQVLALNLPEEDANRQAIDRLVQDCDRLAELLKGVLTFSRSMDPEMEPLDIAVLLRRLLDRLHPRLAKVNVEPHLRAEPGCPRVLGNMRSLEQVFNNLINNAVQAMNDTGGQINIKVHTFVPEEGLVPGLDAPAYVEISVADTGPGIPKDVLDHLFQPFYTTHEHGTGLGLAICRRIVTAHKGTIRVSSFPGGTVFYVRLPVAD